MVSILVPAILSASSMAFLIERVVSSMSDTMPRRSPVVRACPTPRILRVTVLLPSPPPPPPPTARAITAVVFEEPMSRPAMMRSGFIAALRSPDRDNGNRAHQRVLAGERDRFQRERYRPTAPLTVLLELERATFDGRSSPYRRRFEHRSRARA